MPPTSSLAAAFLRDSSVCLIEPFLRRLGVAEGLGTSLRPTEGLFGVSRFVSRWFPSISVGDEFPFLLPGTGLAATFPFSSVGRPNSFLLKLGLAWILAILSDSSRSLLSEGRRVSDDVGSATDFLKDPFLVNVEGPLSASSTFFFRIEGFLLRGIWVGGMAATFSSAFSRNEGRRARPAAFAVACKEWPTISHRPYDCCAMESLPDKVSRLVSVSPPQPRPLRGDSFEATQGFVQPTQDSVGARCCHPG